MYYAPKEVIAVLEGIYEALIDEKQFILTNGLDLNNVDDLFDETLNYIYQSAEYLKKVKILAALNDCCIEE